MPGVTQVTHTSPSPVRDANVQYDENENTEYEGEFSTHPIVDVITKVGRELSYLVVDTPNKC